MKKYFKVLLLAVVAFVLISIPQLNDRVTDKESDLLISEDGYYTSKDEVALYIIEYNKLPSNYITKDEARDLGWKPSENNLWQVSDKKSIGGDLFYNREGLLPKSKDRHYYEADIDYNGKRRNAKRIVFSNDKLIYYTDDHYDSFEKLYGDE